MTLAQDHDTFLGPGQQFYEILFQSMHSMKSYGSILKSLYALIVALIFDQPRLKVITLPWGLGIGHRFS